MARRPLETDDAAAGADAHAVHLGEQRRVAHQLVGQQHGERLVADRLAGAADGVAEATRVVLVDDRRPPVRPDAADPVGQLGLAGRPRAWPRRRAMARSRPRSPACDRLLTTTMWSIPAPSASSMMIWSAGVSPIGNSSFGTALVAGRKRVPMPAAGMTALRTCMAATISFSPDAHLRLQVPGHRRDHRGPAVVRRRDPDRGRPSAHRRHDGGQEGLPARRRDVQGRRLLQDRQPRHVESRRRGQGRVLELGRVGRHHGSAGSGDKKSATRRARRLEGLEPRRQVDSRPRTRRAAVDVDGRPSTSTGGSATTSQPAAERCSSRSATPQPSWASRSGSSADRASTSISTTRSRSP